MCFLFLFFCLSIFFKKKTGAKFLVMQQLSFYPTSLFCFLCSLEDDSGCIHTTHRRPTPLLASSVKALCLYHTIYLRLLEAFLFVSWPSKCWVLFRFGLEICFLATWKHSDWYGAFCSACERWPVAMSFFACLGCLDFPKLWLVRDPWRQCCLDCGFVSCGFTRLV